MPHVLAISMGDPGSIAPEVLVKALPDVLARHPRTRVLLFGTEPPLRYAARLASIAPFWTRAADPASATAPGVHLLDDEPHEPFPAEPNPRAGEASFRWVLRAIDACRDGHASAVVTAPISKHAWALAGHAQFPGHTELLAHRFDAPRHAMMFVTPSLRVALATAHVPLARVPAILSRSRLLDVLQLAHDACRRLGVHAPRLAVCGLNPHAGEAGLLGDEDDRVIAPAVAAARDRGLDVLGPFPADTLFRDAIDLPHRPRRYDLILAMYHDQGLIPVKLLDFDRAVNTTLGLPVPRTSPDHGTAFDLAGKNAADPGSMRAAIDLALAMSP